MSIYAELSYNDQKVEIQEVKGIQFSILSPEEIIKRSVVKITKTDTYAGNEPVIGGLFDSRMVYWNIIKFVRLVSKRMFSVRVISGILN